MPGGGATATAFTASMLHRAGVDTGEAAAAFGTSTGLQLATTLALPVLALPAILAGAPVSRSLTTAAYLGIGLLVVLLAAGAAGFLTDAPLKVAGGVIQWLLNATIRRRRHVTQLSQQLLGDRDFIRMTIGERWRAAVVAAALNTGFDYLALLCALRAVGADPRPSLVLLAYTAGELLALIPFTPGGLGFVEAGLVGTLALAGVSGHDALAATLLYRLAAYWLPIPAGGPSVPPLPETLLPVAAEHDLRGGRLQQLTPSYSYKTRLHNPGRRGPDRSFAMARASRASARTPGPRAEEHSRDGLSSVLLLLKTRCLAEGSGRLRKQARGRERRRTPCVRLFRSCRRLWTGRFARRLRRASRVPGISGPPTDNRRGACQIELGLCGRRDRARATVSPAEFLEGVCSREHPRASSHGWVGGLPGLIVSSACVERGRTACRR